MADTEQSRFQCSNKTKVGIFGALLIGALIIGLVLTLTLVKDKPETESWSFGKSDKKLSLDDLTVLREKLTSEYDQHMQDNSGSPPCENLEECLEELYEGSKPKKVKGFIKEFPKGRISKKEFITKLTIEAKGKEEYWTKIFNEFDSDGKGLTFVQLMMAKQKIWLNIFHKPEGSKLSSGCKCSNDTEETHKGIAGRCLTKFEGKYFCYVEGGKESSCPDKKESIREGKKPKWWSYQACDDYEAPPMGG